ncbi:MAG: hypothetical protein KGI38_02805 [Thaumarchaeota archaeon]|nr:hypothetical protein [Nitrososphaerota archaeon]
MKEIHMRNFPIHYAKGRKLFHIIVHMSDAPGSMSAILDGLGKRVNFIGMTSYSLSDGTAMLTAFAESLSPTETPERLKAVLVRLSANLEADVREGVDGLLVDTFHTGIRVGDDDYILMRREGLARVYDYIVKIFGTGGEVLLYEQGKALGKDNAQRRVKELGVENVVSDSSYLGRALTAQGWGVVESTTKPESKEVRITVADCFECSGAERVRKGCDFYRGFWEGSAEVTRGKQPVVKEIECRLRGSKACVFQISTA